jgi:threonine dehydratase
LDLQQDLKTMQAPSVRREQISAVHAVIRPYVRLTPIINIDLADFGRRAHPVTCKLEFLQHAGSFKPRGAFANLLCRPVPPAGVVAASGGNHGLAVAFAARTLGVQASIFVPNISAATKRERIASLGAKLSVVGERYADALAASQHFAAESGALQVHAFDQHETLLGQGSIGLELEQQCPQLDTLLVAVGGGGLIAGIAAWFAGKIRIVGVEPRLAPTLYRALEAGRPVDAEAGGIAADSLAPKRVGELVFPLAKYFVERVVLVEDDSIREAQRELWRVMRIVSEPGGAAVMAAVLSGAYQPRPGERIAVLLCGANTDSVSL